MDEHLAGVNLAERLPEWILHLQAQGIAASSQRTFHVNVRQFVTFCLYKKIPIAAVDWKLLEEWIRHLQAAKQKPSTINNKIQSLRSFYDFLRRAGDVEYNPTHDIKSVKREKRLPTYLTQEDIIKIIEAAPTIRDRAFIEVLYGCGVRRGEIVGLNEKDVLWQEAILRVMGKGLKERLIPIPLPCLSQLRAWMPERKRVLEETRHIQEPALFVSRYGERLSLRMPKKILVLAAKSAGYDTSIHPHLFRHSYATHLYNNGADIRAVQVLMGHEHLSTTEIYTHVGTKKLTDTVKNFHPRA